jgi:hypothetical protein
VALVVGPILGAPINWFALYLGPAIVVALIALTPLFKRAIIFGAVSGLGVATVGLWLESLWVDAVYHYPWPTSMWPEALAMAIPVAVLTGACGAMFGLVLTSLGALPSQAVGPPARRAGGRLPSRAISIGLVVLTVLAIGSATANGLRYHVPQNVTATITLADVPAQGPGQRMVNADVRVNPLDFVSDNANWVSILGWQGRLENQRGEVVTNLEKLGPGHYRTEPVPVWGTWKTLLRLHDGETLAAVPIYLAGDPGIGAKEGSGRGVDDAAVRRRDHHSAARAQPRDACAAVDGRLPGGSGLHAGSHRWPQLGRRPDQPQRGLWQRGRTSAHGAGVTRQPGLEILAHHGPLLAIPAFAPAIAVAGVVIYVALRDRRREGDAPQGENSVSPRQDG